MTTDIRTRVAVVAAFATISLLSVVSALGYVATVNATRQSQVDLINERLDELEQRLAAGDDELSASLQLDLSLRVLRTGDPPASPRPGTLQVVRPSDHAGVVALVGTVSTSQIDRTLATVRTGLWISVLVIGLLVGVTAWIVVDRALSPVRRLTGQVRAIEADRSSQLLPVTGPGDEIAELATTFNAMLAKLRAADSDRRRFVSDASHEFRTPLMVLMADAEYAIDHPGPSQELARSVLDQSGRLTALVDDLLTLATVDEGQTSSERVRTVAEVLGDAGADWLAPDLDPTVAAVRVPDVSRSIANIVANANRYRRSTVELAVALTGSPATESLVTITVDDDGPGVPVDERDEIFKRFYRPDRSRTRSGGGAGLGLAIAKAEVNQAGGTITIGDSPLGGARFAVVVPQIS